MSAPCIEVSIQPEGSPRERIDVSDLVLALTYEDCENKADKLELTIDNADLRNFDDPIWRKGNKVIVSWGYSDAMAVPRICQIRKVTGFKKLKIECLGREVELNVETKVRSFEGKSRADVAREIAGEWGFREESLLHIQDTRVTREHIVQARQTDAQFLRRLAAKEGFEWYIDFDGFHFHERNFFQHAIKRLTWNDEDLAGQIQDITVENDVTRRPGSVKVKGIAQKRTIDVDASILTEKERAALGTIVDAPGKTEKDTPGFQSIAHHEVKTTTEQDPQAAARVASAEFRKAQQMAVKLTITMVGDPNMLAKSVIELGGVGKRLSQSYYVRTVKHAISGAYTTTLECVSDGTGGHSTQSRLAHGASPVQVGPAIQGKKVVKTVKRSIDVDPELLPGGKMPGADAPAAPPPTPAATPPKELTPITKADGSVAYTNQRPGVPGADSAGKPETTGPLIHGAS